MIRTGWKTLSWVLTAALVSALVAEEPLLLSEESGGILELEGERRLEIVGVNGLIVVRQGKPGELRFAARKSDDTKTERPVALWLDGSTLRLAPAEGLEDEPLRLEVSIPAEFDTRFKVVDSTVNVSGLRGRVEVSGERLLLTIRSIEASVDLELSDSTVQLVSVTEDVDLQGDEIDGRFDNVGGLLTLNVQTGDIRVNHLRGELDADLEDAVLAGDNLMALVRVEASGGSTSLFGCRAGARLILSDTPLELRQSKGSIEIDSDAEVRFQEHEGPLTVRGSGAAVYGGKLSGGALDIETSGAEVRLEDIEGATMIRGDRLDVHVTGSKGELTVSTTSSNVQVDKAQTAVTIENDFGNVEIHEATKLVQVFSRDGEVRLDGLKGPAQVRADGPTVEVHWTAFSGTESSSVENARGDVRVSVPTNARCRIDAHAPNGRVESDIEELHISDDGHSASGLLSGGRAAAPQVKKPTIEVKAAGDLYVFAAGQLASER